MSEATTSMIPLQTPIQLRRALILAVAAGCFLSWISAPIALLLGIAFAVLLSNPDPALTKKLTPKLLSTSIIGLGAGMNMAVVGKTGLHGFGYTLAGISSTLILGALLRRLLGVESVVSTLITVGTAICGGSAIAAVAPIVRAKPAQMSVALGTVFLLNSFALVLFPIIGHQLHLTEPQFGLWSALAIHDTSSVVGATLQYGPKALEIGTTVKLARALWIIPISILFGFLYRDSSPMEGGAKPKRPWFILGFVLMATAVTLFPVLQPAGHFIELIAKRSLVLTLFMIGLQLDPKTLQSVGLKPLIQGVVLWAIVLSASLAAIVFGHLT